METVLANNVEFRLNRPWKYIAWNVLQRIEALGKYDVGPVVLKRQTPLREVIRACKWMEEQALRQLDMERGK